MEAQALQVRDERSLVEWLGGYLYAKAIHVRRYHAQGVCTAAREGVCAFAHDRVEEIRAALEEGGEQESLVATLPPRAADDLRQALADELPRGLAPYVLAKEWCAQKEYHEAPKRAFAEEQFLKLGKMHFLRRQAQEIMNATGATNAVDAAIWARYIFDHAELEMRELKARLAAIIATAESNVAAAKRMIVAECWAVPTTFSDVGFRRFLAGALVALGYRE